MAYNAPRPDKIGDKTVECDVLVVGGGAAGLTAAWAARQSGARVLLVARGGAGRGSTALAQGGIAAALGDGDDPAQHAADTLVVGAGLCEPAAVQVLVHEVPRAVEDLLRLGARFAQEDGSLGLWREGGHSRARVVHAPGGQTGAEVSRVLLRAARGSGVTFMAGEVLDLVPAEPGWVAWVWTEQGGHPVRAGSVVLATGGMGGVFAATTNPADHGGEGLALAYELGAAAMDVEFIQFHPTVLDTGRPGERPLLSEALRGAGAHIVDEDGRRFVAEALPAGELAPRDLVARAVAEHRRRGHRAYLTLRHLPASTVREAFADLARLVGQYGWDLARDLLPIAPAAHYAMGGVRTDLDGWTGIPGLYAAGEVAATGVHGACRLASNSLAECLVFGRRAGLAAAARVRGLPPRETPPPPWWLPGPELPWTHAQAVERALGVCRAEGPLLDLQSRLDVPGTPRHVGERRRQLRTLAVTLAVAGALARRESRGTHFRSDYPRPDTGGARHTVQRKGQGLRWVAVGEAEGSWEVRG